MFTLVSLRFHTLTHVVLHTILNMLLFIPQPPPLTNLKGTQMPCSYVHVLYWKIPEHFSQHADGGPLLHSLLGSIPQGCREQRLGSTSVGTLGMASHMWLLTDWKWTVSFGSVKAYTCGGGHAFGGIY